MSFPPSLLLLRLPPTLRTHLLSTLRPPTVRRSPPLPSRPFTTTLHRLDIPHSKRPPRATPPKPRQTTAPLRPLPRNRHSPHLAPLLPLLHNHPKLLLYRAPSHTTFYTTAYLIGASAILAGYIYARTVKETRLAADAANAANGVQVKAKWYTAYLPWAVAVFFVSMGWVFISAPMKLVKAVWLVEGAGAGAAAGSVEGARMVPMIRIETKHIFPLFGWQGKTMEVPVGRAYLDGAVAMKGFENDMMRPWTSIPVGQVVKFTAAYSIPTPPRGVLGTLRDFNSSLINIFPELLKNLRRMASREGLAHVQIPDEGRWKLDIQGAEQLEDGKVLAEVMSGPYVPSWFQRWLSR